MPKGCTKPTIKQGDSLYYILHQHAPFDGISKSTGNARRLSELLKLASKWFYVEKGHTLTIVEKDNELLWLVEQSKKTSQIRRNLVQKAKIMHRDIVDIINQEEELKYGRKGYNAEAGGRSRD